MQKLISIWLLTLMMGLTIPAVSQLNYNNLSVYHDLEGAEINDVITDHLGRLWITTPNGLVCFDGYDFTHYYPNPNDSTSLGSILTLKLFEDRKGNIWIGCVDLISEYNPTTKKFRNYRSTPLTSLPFDAQATSPVICQDSSGRIYFGISSQIGVIGTHTILYKDEDEDAIKRLEYPDSLGIQNVYHADFDNSGKLWMITESGFFSIGTDRKIRRENWPTGHLPEQNRSSLQIRNAHNGTMWLTSNSCDLVSWAPMTGMVKRYVLNVDVKDDYVHLCRDLETDPKGNVWMATDRGLLFFDGAREKYEQFEGGEDQKYARIRFNCLSVDTFDNLWIGTVPGVLMKYGIKPVFKSFIHNDHDPGSITQGWITKIFENKEGKIWMASSGDADRAGIDEYDPKSKTLKPYRFKSFMPGMDWYNVVGEQSPDQFLIQTSKGAFLFNTLTKKLSPTILDPVFDSIFLTNLYTDRKGNLWYCTTQGVFLNKKGTNRIQHFRLIPELGSNYPNNEVTKIFEDKDGGLWILSNQGLFRYDQVTGTIRQYGSDRKKGNVLSSQDINSFYMDDQDIAWIGTWGGGLCRYDIASGKIKIYTTSNGLPSMSIQGILADKKNQVLWLSTFEGISRFSIPDEQFNNFSFEDGIQGRLFTDGAYLRTSAGQFIFGGNNGITVFDPDDIARNSKPPIVFISDFRIGNKSLNPGEWMTKVNRYGKGQYVSLKYRQDNISVYYDGIHYASPARNKFEYILENYDDQWREVGNQRTAYYYGLPPGNYTFRVRAANSNGVWNQTGASIEFRITPPWWRTWLAYSLYAMALAGLILGGDRLQRRYLLQKERQQAREKELAQAREIEKAYRDLKATQAQLIHSEKMASLGELTAGIAHEIQNPLNFVNNFSEVSVDLLKELNDEIDKGDPKEMKSLVSDIQQSLDKIGYHGKRASTIVKGMLEHSRTGSGVKEPTDLNVLADEYLRLAYHGLRAKDKAFNADFKAELDPDLPKVNVIPQDIGRVLLNLINNAFYAVANKTLTGSSNLSGSQNLTALKYAPTVTVSTKNHGDHVEIRVADNGNGIPAEVLGKIFQPFFTTKPTGQGTGLGLSLSFDIVTKGHGGELKVETEVGKGTDFIIHLPIA